MDLINSKYFKSKSERERAKGILISILLLFGIIIMFFDIYSSLRQSKLSMVYIESLCMFYYIVLYILFPKYLDLQSTLKFSIGTLVVLILLSLIIPGANHYYALFWLAVLPVYIFFFFGIDLGVKWSFGVIVGLFIVILNSIFKWAHPLYDIEFLLQLLLGYIAVSYLLYILEQERVGYEINLEQLIKNQNILLKEVHHRTKNNMQIMIALLETQYFKMDDVKCKRVFKSHINRLQSMALVHEYLYKGDSYEMVALDKYFFDISKQYQEIVEHSIILKLDPVVVDMKTAINLALIYNEALSNAIEHAFDNKTIGNIEVSLKKYTNECKISIKDNGKGFDTTKKNKTLGLNLIRDIASSLSSKPISILSNQKGTIIEVYCNI
jgi:two-component sensor histidine kinase